MSSFKIAQGNINEGSYGFFGSAGLYKKNATKEEAKAELGKILTFVGSDTEALKSGALRLVQNSDGSYELKKRTLSPYHLFSFLGWGRDIGAADDYINGVMKAAGVEGAGAARAVTVSNESQVKGSLFTSLTSYFMGKKITAEEFLKRSPDFKLITHSASKGNESVPDFSPIMKNAGVSINSNSIQGNPDYRKATVEGFTDPFYFKTLSPDQPNQKRDAAASKANSSSLDKATKPIALLVSVKKENQESIEYHYLPVSEVKAFKKEIEKQNPKATITTAAELRKSLPTEGSSGDDPLINCLLDTPPSLISGFFNVVFSGLGDM